MGFDLKEGEAQKKKLKSNKILVKINGTAINSNSYFNL